MFTNDRMFVCEDCLQNIFKVLLNYLKDKKICVLTFYIIISIDEFRDYKKTLNGCICNTYDFLLSKNDLINVICELNIKKLFKQKVTTVI